MTQLKLDLTLPPQPSRHYDEGLFCPGCHDSECSPTNPVMDAIGFVWHIKCYVAATLAYGEFASRHSTAGNLTEDLGDTHDKDMSNPTEYHVTKGNRQ